MALLITKDLLDEVGISRTTLFRLVEEGLLFTQVGKKKMYNPDVVREFMTKRKDNVQRDLVPGQDYSDDDITQIFRCNNMGGMRKSNTKNALVLISNSTGHGRTDINYWKDDTLFFSGLSTRAGQGKLIGQDKWLAECNEKGITVYLFESYQSKTYRYRGIVRLAGEPFLIEEKVAHSDEIRNVWKFPLKLVAENDYLPEDFIESLQQEETDAASDLDKHALINNAKGTNRVVSEVRTTTRTYMRSPVIARFVKMRANGVCELCGKNAPFIYKGEPYLESYYIKPLRDDGMDSVDNVAALCPNCHRKVECLKAPEDIAIITKRVDDGNWLMDDYFTVKRLIECPHCGEENRIDFADFSNVSSDERPMGESNLYEFDEDYICDYCGKPFNMNGYISEYPAGAFEHEDIKIEKRQDED